MDNKIIFRIETDNPLPVEDFTKSLEAFNREYVAFSSVAELHISEIRKGSFEVEFINCVIPLGIFGGLTQLNNIFDFIKHLKSIIESLKRDKEKTTKRKESVQNISDISRPIINYGTLNIISGGENIILNSQDAQDINKVAQKVLPQKSKIIEDSETNKIYKKILFYWWQAGFNEKKPNSGNKGIIENISKNPFKVIFKDDDSQTKKEMTTSQNGIDWQKINYIVDVEVITKNNKIVLYKILHNYPNDCLNEDAEVDF